MNLHANQLFTGVVENRDDPLKLGRCQVRVMGLNTYDKNVLPTKDLPWAYPLQPVTSAAMSGIGHAPVGPVEGTIVVIMFRDDDQQHPIILGSLGGIPQTQGRIDEEDAGPVLKQDGYAPQEGTVVTDDTGAKQQSTTDTAPKQVEDTSLKPASLYQISDEGLALIKQYEGVRLTSYQDSVGVWTIGYGTTRIAGNPVEPGETITQQQADELLKQHIVKEVQPAVYNRVTAPITQSMFDALCSFTYNLGGGTLGKSSLKSELNCSKYEECANLFPDYNKAGGNVLAGLTNRRNAEKALFLKDGIPNVSGELQKQEEQPAPIGQVDPTTGEVSSGVAPSARQKAQIGFNDPKGKYPLYVSEPDTNKLARHEDIKKTVVFLKEQARDINVEGAQGVRWSQSPIPYNAQYPFNHVWMSESGHIMEFDDTVGSERVHIYHRKGTFSEIDANGTQVNRIVGDKFEILERNGHVHIKGSAHVTIDGDHTVKVENALKIDVSGKATINVFNDVDLTVSGSMDVSVKETFNLKANEINIQAPDINLTADNTYRETVGKSFYRWNGDKYMYTGDDTYTVKEPGKTDYSCPTDRDGATACPSIASAVKPKVKTPAAKQSPELPEFSELQVVSRALAAAAVYETPEEGDPTEYIKQRIENGTLKKEDLVPPKAEDAKQTPPNKLEGVPPSCAALEGAALTADLQISKSFKLGALCQNGSRMPVDQVGLTAAQITCNLKTLSENCLDKIKEMYPGMMITSGFRRPGDAANSSPTSQHYKGEAADIVISGFNRQKHYEAIQEIQKVIPYDQLLLEYSGSSTVWIHVSYKAGGNRKQNFTMKDHGRISEFSTFTLIT